MQMSRAQRVAVTGVNGFVGRHLVPELVSAGVDVVGVGHEEAAAPDRLGDYVDGDAASAIRTRIDAHLRDCRNCRCFLSQYRWTIAACKCLISDDVRRRRGSFRR